MAARFVEISLEDMDKFLKRSFRALRPKKSQKRGEVYYDLKLGPFVGVRVWTSIGPHAGVGAGVGSDAIRVQFVSLKDEGPLEKGKAPIVKRTQNWRDNLRDRIADLVEKYDDNEEFWENWAGTRQRRGDPEKEIERQEQIERRQEDFPTSKMKHRFPDCARKEGLLIESHVGAIYDMMRGLDSDDLFEVTGFKRFPKREEIKSLSKAQACMIIELSTDEESLRREKQRDKEEREEEEREEREEGDRLEREQEIEDMGLRGFPTPEMCSRFPKACRYQGEITGKQVGLIYYLLKGLGHDDWRRLDLLDVTGFDHIPKRDEMKNLSKAQGSMVISIVQGETGSRYASEDEFAE